MKKLSLYIFLLLMFCNVGFANMVYIKCDIANIKLSDRVSEKDIKMYKKLIYLSFNDETKKKMKNMNGNDAYIFFNWHPEGQVFNDKLKIITLSKTMIIFADAPQKDSTSLMKVMLLSRKTGFLSYYLPAEAKKSEKAVCEKIRKSNLPIKKVDTKF